MRPLNFTEVDHRVAESWGNKRFFERFGLLLRILSEGLINAQSDQVLLAPSASPFGLHKGCMVGLGSPAQIGSLRWPLKYD